MSSSISSSNRILSNWGRSHRLEPAISQDLPEGARAAQQLLVADAGELPRRSRGSPRAAEVGRYLEFC